MAGSRRSARFVVVRRRVTSVRGRSTGLLLLREKIPVGRRLHPAEIDLERAGCANRC